MTLPARSFRTFGAAVALACVALGAASATAGATVTVTPPSATDTTLLVTGGPLDDKVTVSTSGWRLRVADPAGVALLPVAGSPCVLESATVARCTAGPTPLVALGAGADTAIVAGNAWNGVSPELHGDEGDDRFEVGAVATSGVDGGSGNDVVSYAGFSAYEGFTVDLGAARAGSMAAVAGVEAVEGTQMDDRLVGGNGDETLRGSGGDDSLKGGDGRDTLDGGEGDDTIDAVDHTPDHVVCGAGDDVATVDPEDSLDGCEKRQGPEIDVAPRPGVVPGPRPPKPGARPIRVRPEQSPARVVSGPAADNLNSKVGARVRTRTARNVRLVVREGEREIGAAEGAGEAGGEVTLTVKLDAAVRERVARERHVELSVSVENAPPGDGPTLTEDHSVTLVEPPPFVRGTLGVTRRGGFGPERLSGTARGDVLAGASGDDRLAGRGGNDDLEGGTGNDRLLGSAGDDRLDGYDGDDLLLGGAGDDLIVESRFGDDTIDGGPGDDWIVGGRGSDVIRGGSGDDVIFGGSAPDTIDCGAGNDTVFVNLESERKSVRNCETVLEEDDVPSIPCDAGEGTDNGETMLGSDAADVCKGAGGDDDVEGAAGSDQLFGGDGDDRIFGRFGNDQLFGEGGDDELEGGRGEDRLDGGPGDDQLNGGYGRDRLDGGPGNDTLIARGGGSDVLDCGPGRDVAIADRSDRLRGCETVRRR